MSDSHQDHEEIRDSEPVPVAPESLGAGDRGEAPPAAPIAPQAEASSAPVEKQPAPHRDGRRDNSSDRGEAAVKVVDRRFWARQEGEEAGTAGTASPSTRPKLVEELETRLRDTQARLREVLIAVQKADKENDEFRERLRRDLERRVALAKADLFREVVEVADNLERALLAPAATPELSRGVEQVLSQVRRLLTSQGVEELPVSGLPFDPQVAEAIEVREVPDAESDGRVIEVTHRGYRFAGRTLRPARVIVGRFTAPG